MVNNFEQIKGLMEFRSEDDFYYMVILKRKKENPEIGSNSYAVKHYFFTSIGHLQSLEEEIKQLCTEFNARACIYLNRRSFEKCAFHTMAKIANILLGKNYREVKKAYTSICGMYNNETEKKWIIDVDDKNADELPIITCINSLPPVAEYNKIICKIPTRNGYHLITSPFAVDVFRMHGFTMDIQKDNPSLLYIP
jgi:hypothetical protein